MGHTCTHKRTKKHVNLPFKFTQCTGLFHSGLGLLGSFSVILDSLQYFLKSKFYYPLPQNPSGSSISMVTSFIMSIVIQTVSFVRMLTNQGTHTLQFLSFGCLQTSRNNCETEPTFFFNSLLGTQNSADNCTQINFFFVLEALGRFYREYQSHKHQ